MRAASPAAGAAAVQGLPSRGRGLVCSRGAAAAEVASQRCRSASSSSSALPWALFATRRFNAGVANRTQVPVLAARVLLNAAQQPRAAPHASGP